jgi:MarR family transcriptional regulator for hemolysin
MMITELALQDGRVVLAAEMALTSRRWRKLVDERLRAFGLTHSRWQVLLELAAAPLGLNQRALADRLAIEPASLVGQLDALEMQGLIERSAAPGDRRANAVLLTPDAVALSGQVAAIVDELRARATAGIGRDELVAAMRVLRKITSNLEQK